MLDTVLGRLARQQDPNVLVGFDKADDAGVYRLDDRTALVQTVDFFTPIVDDPFTYGQIAAVNSLSDVYAMGGRPISSLAMVCFPDKGDLGVLEQILSGGLSKMMEAKCAVIGGHSVRDPEIKFGYAVTGVIDPARVLANQGAFAGDALIFTKSLGTGVISTAIKKGQAKSEWIAAATASMTTLNKAAGEVVARKEFEVHALTDITGFGLIGHAREMAIASGVTLRIAAARVSLLQGALDCVLAGFIPGGLNANREFAECVVSYGENIPDELKTILFDPQTAGGLLISVRDSHSEPLLGALNDAGVSAARIGRVIQQQERWIEVY